MVNNFKSPRKSHTATLDHRFNFVLTEQDNIQLRLLWIAEKDRGNVKATIGSVIRNLIRQEAIRQLTGSEGT